MTSNASVAQPRHYDAIRNRVAARLPRSGAKNLSDDQLIGGVSDMVADAAARLPDPLSIKEQRALVTLLVEEIRAGRLTRKSRPAANRNRPDDAAVGSATEAPPPEPSPPSVDPGSPPAATGSMPTDPPAYGSASILPSGAGTGATGFASGGPAAPIVPPMGQSGGSTGFSPGPFATGGSPAGGGPRPALSSVPGGLTADRAGQTPRLAEPRLTAIPGGMDPGTGGPDYRQQLADLDAPAANLRPGDKVGGADFARTRSVILSAVLERIDAGAASQLSKENLMRQLEPVVLDISREIGLTQNADERQRLVRAISDDLLGFGPLEPLLADPSVSDIMVNGPERIFVERNGKLELSRIRFRDSAHLMNIATRIVSRVGRRIDETSPICDARLPDGSRVNIIIPPLALDFPLISIRKFSDKKLALDDMARSGSMSDAMAQVLKIAGRARLNIVVSGGTGSGKTTMLNALSRMIDPGERVVTIEDTAELQLQQPHVARLETRPPNLEGKGAIEMRDLVKNALRMRPDRIILGEVRGGEALDMLQAMNTGHEGSMCTLHANKPREALTRIENMVLMGATNLPQRVIRSQIAAAVDLIIQISRMRDGRRRVTSIQEITGMEGDVVLMQELFSFDYKGEDQDGILQGEFRSHGVRPEFTPRAGYFGLDQALLAAIGA